MKNKPQSQIFHFDLYGKREEKYNFLNVNSLKSIKWNELQPEAPNYFFRMKDSGEEDLYNKGFSIQELFPLNSLGLLTKRDNLSIDFSTEALIEKIEFFLDENKSVHEVCKHFDLVVKDKDKWDAVETRNLVSKSGINNQIKDVQYRPFDNRKVFYNPYFVARPNTKVLVHFIKENMGLIVCRQGQAVGGDEWNVVFTCKHLTDQNVYRRGGGTIFPLYLYPDTSGQQCMEMGAEVLEAPAERIPNLNPEIVKQIAEGLGLTFTNEKPSGAEALPSGAEALPSGAEALEAPASFAPIDLLDYIYAVLHSPTYREKYKEFLKIDFPRVPYPKDKDTFWQLVQLGGELRQIHLLESPVVEQFITQYPVDGDNVIDKPRFVSTSLNERGKVYINDTQYFDNVPEIAWNFYIGGYQPAQKWLKDRKGRTLEFEDILHYQKIVVALTETERIMGEIDKVKQS